MSSDSDFARKCWNDAKGKAGYADASARIHQQIADGSAAALTRVNLDDLRRSVDGYDITETEAEHIRYINDCVGGECNESNHTRSTGCQLNGEPAELSCEGDHPRPVPAVATWHLTESRSAANITFVCAACAVKGVQETLAEGTWDAFELRPLEQAP